MIELSMYERSEREETEASCGHRSVSTFWRKALPKKSVWFSQDQRSESARIHAQVLLRPYDHLRAKLRKRSADRPTLMPFYHRHTLARSFPPPAIKNLIDAIQQSRVLLQFEDDWDGDGSSGYSESTWNRAQNFLLKNALQLWRRHKTCFDSPTIQPGPYGSIDLHWRTRKRELLINVSSNLEEPISYYGDDKDEGTENAIRGKNLDDASGDTEWIFLWLMK